MKVGDLISYKYPRMKRIHGRSLVLQVNKPGGTLKTLDGNGRVSWFPIDYCEVINESR